MTERYENQIAWHDKKSGTNKKYYLATQATVIILAVVTSVTTALSWMAIPIIASAIVSVLTGVQKLFQYHELWISYRITAETLRQERYLHLGRIGEYRFSDTPDQLFVERVEHILSGQTRGWASQQSKARAQKDDSQAAGS